MDLTIVLLVIAFAAHSHGGSPCLPRNAIYPCMCTNIPAARRQVWTVVTCHGLRNSDQLRAIFTALKSIEIDKFLLYDSFWEASELGGDGDSQKRLPGNWLWLLKIKEMEVVDTHLSDKFACGNISKSNNTVTTRFALENSTSFEDINSICTTKTGMNYAWTDRMKNLTHFRLSHGKLTSFGGLFQLEMENLIELYLNHNRIKSIEPKALASLRKLSILDLSYNALESLAAFDGNKLLNLVFLDVSGNFIKTLGNKLFLSLPRMKHFKADSNSIKYLNKKEWISISNALKIVNLDNNPIHCGCNIRWIKHHLPKNVTLSGLCTTPEEYKNLHIRKASNAVNIKYDENCILKSKKSSTTVRNG